MLFGIRRQVQDENYSDDVQSPPETYTISMRASGPRTITSDIHVWFYGNQSWSNVSVVDGKCASFHQYLEYCQRNGSIVFMTASIIA